MSGVTPIAVDLEFDIETITIEEIEILEDVTGTAFENFDWNSKSRAWLRALAYIAGRRQDASFTLEDAGRVPVMSLFGGKRAQAAPEAPPDSGDGGEDPTPAS